MSTTEATEAPAQPGEDRELLAVLAAKGGCGATLLCVNLAAEMAAVRGSGEVCVIDLDFSKGDVAGVLGLSPKHTVPHLTAQAHDLDSSMLRGAATLVRSGNFHILPQPSRLADMEMVTREEIAPLLRVARQTWSRVVVDCGARIDAATLTTVVEADAVCVVLTPDLPALRNAIRLIELLRKVGVPRDRIRPVLNKVSRRSRLPEEDIQDQLGLPVYATIHRDEAACSDADLEARLLRDVAPHSRTTRDIRKSWGAIDPAEEEPQPRRWRFPWQ